MADNYTPTTESVQSAWVASRGTLGMPVRIVEAQQEFDRWMEGLPAADRRVTPDREQATALYAIVKEHGFDPMESRNLGYYRTEVTCFCGVTLWWGDHEGDPHYTETWNGHIVDALLASGVLDGTSKESAPDLTCPGDVSKPLPGVLGIPADQRDDRFDGPPRMYRGYPQAGHPPQFYGPDDVAVDGDWLAELEKTVSDQRTADRETISQALRKVYGYYAPVSALSAADAVLAVLVPADLIRAEAMDEAAELLVTYDFSGLAYIMRARAAEYRKAAGAPVPVVQRPTRDEAINTVQRAIWESKRGPLMDHEWVIVRDQHGETATLAHDQAALVVDALLSVFPGLTTGGTE